MKNCPKCNSSYSDEKLIYCLTDGTELVADEISKKEIPSDDLSAEVETIITKTSKTKENRKPPGPDTAKQNAPSSNKSKSRTYPIVAVLLVTIAVGGYLLYSSGANGGKTTLSGVFSGPDSPTEAYKRLYAAVKSKDTAAIKQQLTKKTIEFASSVSQRNNTPLEKVFENGFTATTFSETLPTIRDERIVENMAGIEVWNSKESKWEDLPYVKEDGVWKLAVGELFGNTFKPEVVGRGRAFREAEAANAVKGNQMIPGLPPNSNMNTAANLNAIPVKPRMENKVK